MEPFATFTDAGHPELDSWGTLLVVEDATYVRRILVYNLEKAGYRTVQAENGLEALAFLRSRRFDAVLLDISMPLLDGLSVCRTLKQDPSLWNIPVIICTGRNDRGDVARALSAGADDYVVKPYDRNTILRKLDRLLGRTEPVRVPGIAAGAPAAEEIHTAVRSCMRFGVSLSA